MAASGGSRGRTSTAAKSRRNSSTRKRPASPTDWRLTPPISTSPPMNQTTTTALSPGRRWKARTGGAQEDIVHRRRWRARHRDRSRQPLLDDAGRRRVGREHHDQRVGNRLRLRSPPRLQPPLHRRRRPPQRDRRRHRTPLLVDQRRDLRQSRQRPLPLPTGHRHARRPDGAARRQRRRSAGRARCLRRWLLPLLRRQRGAGRQERARATAKAR